MRAALLSVSLALVGTSVAFPSFLDTGNAGSVPQGKRQTVNFDPVKQLVDVTGNHRFIPPGSNDQRGPCPGMNSLANHGYISRTGITTFDESVAACQEVFNFGLDTCIGVTVLGLVYGGNTVTGRFSIGGPAPPPGLGTPLVLANPPGLSGTHNKMEGDASATRGDAYTNNGDASSLSSEHFKHLYDLGSDGRNIDGAAMINHRAWTRNYSISTNPHYFSGPIPVVIVSTLTHFLTTRAFSNHSVDQPQGFLSQEVLKSFHGVSGGGDSLVYLKGHEQIPNKWYKRPDQYTLAHISQDLGSMALAYPDFLSVGGNTGTNNSFTGVDTGNLTGGVYNLGNLLQGNNLICFLSQAAEATVVGGGPNALPLLKFLSDKFASIVDPRTCPTLATYNTSLFDIFPGAKSN